MANDPLRRATVSPEQAQALAGEHFGVRGRARVLPGERDVNFELVADDGMRYVLKVAPAGERMEVIDLELAALDHLAQSAEPVQRFAGLAVPRVVKTEDGEDRIVWN